MTDVTISVEIVSSLHTLASGRKKVRTRNVKVRNIKDN
jgi:hypothetical protein